MNGGAWRTFAHRSASERLHLTKLQLLHAEATLRGFLTLLFFSLLAPADGFCTQNGSTLELGDLVRVSAPDLDIDDLIAYYLRLHRDTLTVQGDSATFLPVRSVTRLDVSLGISNTPTYIGMAGGAVAGVLFGIVIASDEAFEVTSGPEAPQPYGEPMRSENQRGSSGMSGAAVAPIGCALIGTFVGGLVGKAFRKHTWLAYPLEKLHVSILPNRSGVPVAGLAIRW